MSKDKQSNNKPRQTNDSVNESRGQRNRVSIGNEGFMSINSQRDKLTDITQSCATPPRPSGNGNPNKK